MQSDSSVPLLVSTDQEGGSVNRMYTIEGPLSSAFEMGATRILSYAKQRGAQDAATLASVGINLNLAPDVDVLNTSGGDIGARSFGTTPSRVITMAGAYLDGLQASGKVVGTLKHFPGLGACALWTHTQHSIPSTAVYPNSTKLTGLPIARSSLQAMSMRSCPPTSCYLR